MSHTPDQIIEARWIIPIEPAGVVLPHHAVAIREGKVEDLLPISTARDLYPHTPRVSLPDHVLTPGFVNTHVHAAMTLLRGLADDLPLMEWLQNAIWPAEGKHVSEKFVFDGTLLACAEMLRGGTTCFADMYFFPDAAARATDTLGLRAVMGLTVIEFPTPYASDVDDYLAKGLAARDAWAGHSRIGFTMAPHAPYTISDDTFRRIQMLSDQLELPVQIHVHETATEINDSLKAQHVRPLSRMHALGLIGPGLLAVHGVHLNEQDIELLARHGGAVAHCPTSNMKLASGIAPVCGLRAAGVPVGLGTDGAASNNRLDMLQEMRHAALLAKVSSGDAAALKAHDVLRMATLEGAETLGLGDKIGSIEKGKWADLAALDLSDWICAPHFNPASHLVYVAGREHISHVWVGGQLKVADRHLLAAENLQLLETAKVWQNALRL
jgi:5-methylthioadenosine/S-adenosylhomocysteine deaminase